MTRAQKDIERQYRIEEFLGERCEDRTPTVRDRIDALAVADDWEKRYDKQQQAEAGGDVESP